VERRYPALSPVDAEWSESFDTEALRLPTQDGRQYGIEELR